MSGRVLSDSDDGIAISPFAYHSAPVKVPESQVVTTEKLLKRVKDLETTVGELKATLAQLTMVLAQGQSAARVTGINAGYWEET